MTITMAQCRQTAHEFIQNAFSPMVAVLCSHDAEQLCQKNNLSFVEMIQPFCRMSQEATLRDPGNNTHTLRNLHIIVKDMNSSIPQPALARKMMSEAVSNSQAPADPTHGTTVLSYGNYNLQLNNSSPWYEAYRNMFLQVAYPSEHEFLKHFLACIYVVSSIHADPMDQFLRLAQQQHQQQHQSPSKLPKWFSPNILKYYVLLHDVADGDEAKAESVYQAMKTTYSAASCHLLQINSRNSLTPEPASQAGMPDPWSQFIAKTEFTEGNIPPDQLVPTQPQNASDGYYPPRLEQEPSFEHVSPIESAAEVTEETCVDRSGGQIDHPLAHLDEEEQYSLPRMMAEVSIPNSASQHSLNALDRMRPQAHGQCLTLSDHDRLRIFVHEFLVRGLIPWAERTMRILNEQIMSRKGIHRSLFSATRKWFGGGKAPLPTPGPQQNTTVIYTQEAPELQMRRFADLAFMFQQYELAYQTYHSLKKDFQNDNAWLHHAGALELASLAIFMQGNTSQRQYPHHYMETATSTYLNTCRTPQFATRATMMNTEALKSKSAFAEAAMQFIKMTSEDSDLRSALMLEQAAHCFIVMKTPMVRKYAFHMILAGHRFSKSGQRRHALRAYSQALQVYKSKGWSLAEDHINFTIGRQSFNLKHLENACSAFKHLLSRESRQTPAQQNAFFREYVFVYKQLLTAQTDDQSQTCLPQLPLPLVDGNRTKVLIGGLKPNRKEDSCICASGVDFGADTTGQTWDLLEQNLVASADNHQPSRGPTIQCYTNRTDNSHHPHAVVREPLFVEIALENPLRVPLVLSDVHLLWQFQARDFQREKNTAPSAVITNERDLGNKKSISDEVIDTQNLAQVIIGPSETQTVQLSLTPHQTGDLHLLGLAYNLGSSPHAPHSLPETDSNNWRPSYVSTITVRGKQVLEVQGPRLNKTLAEKTSRVYGPDRRLDISVVPDMPLLDVKFYNFPEAMLCGEVRLAYIRLENRGTLPLHKLRLGSRIAQFITFGRPDTTREKTVYQTSDQPDDSALFRTIESGHVTVIPLSDGVLNGGASVTLPVWIYGPIDGGEHRIELMFYYEPLDRNPKMKYRVLRHLVRLDTKPAIAVSAVANRSLATSDTPASPQVSSSGDVSPENGSTDNRSLVVNLKIENLNQPHDSTRIEFELVQLTCVSARWSLHHLSTRPADLVTIGQREASLLVCKARPGQANKTDEEVIFSDVTYGEQAIASTATPCAEFYFLSKGSRPLEPVASTRPMFICPESTQKRDFTKLESAVDCNLSVIVLWKATVFSESAEPVLLCGQHHVTLEKLHTLVTVPVFAKPMLEHPPVKIIKEMEELVEPRPDPVAMAQLVKVTIQNPQRTNHDFTLNKLCVVPVTVVVQNCADIDLNIRLETTQPSDSENQEAADVPPTDAPSQSPDAPSPASFFWLGQTSYRAKLAARRRRNLNLNVGVCAAGVFNLNVVQVYVTSDVGDVRDVVQRPYGPALLVVNNSVRSMKT